MKLGKALATGVAQEQPQIRPDELELPREAVDVEAAATAPVPASATPVSAPAPEEVSAAR
ncbi:hypothetical protein ACFV5G_14060 [Streptomyces sp. NPDC059766]|uniref:hypothetical protein n=1 Tax=Streptomyces sp. NPDC059766 TaxID=3346940 RepID=UPI0036533AB9